MAKFKIGQIIEPIEKGRGFEQAKVLGTYIETKKGKFRGREMYKLKILCGTATMPISAEVNYRLSKKKQL